MGYKIKSNKRIICKTLKIADGLLGSITDMVLYTIYFSFEASVAGYGRSYKAAPSAYKDLDECNYKAIKRAFNNLKDRGLINVIEQDSKLSAITEAGRKRLESILPKYDKKRVWDKRIYLVTYDIPVKRNKERNYLRDYLKTIGCRHLQDSVWVTPYNPKKLIEMFVKSKSLEEHLIIVSSMGKDGAIGEKGVKEIVDEIYELSALNEKYKYFIEWIKDKKPPKDEIISYYLGVLKDDPQVPFELLPDDWVGDDAFELYNLVLS